jgi:hypothetical protein
MRNLQTEISIDSPSDRVWATLTDFPNYPNWNPFIKKISGKVEVGNNIEVRIEPPNGRGMTFKPKVLVFDEQKEFRWLGRLWIKGLFDGEHYFILEPIDKKTTKFIHGELFSGLVVGMLSITIEKAKDGFYLMNEALKKYCEGRDENVN